MSEIVRPGEGRFDAIKRTDERGEYWMGRELMSDLDYTKWQNFEAAIKRAMVAAFNAGAPDGQFVQVNEVTASSNLGQQSRVDYRLTRYAAYLVAMEADSTKTAVADAKTYFAIRTRQAETAPAIPDMSTAEGQLAVLDMWRGQVEARMASDQRALEEKAAREVAEQRNAELEPKAAAADALMETEGAVSMGAVANAFKIGRQDLFDMLREEKIIQKDRRPYQDYAEWFRVTVRHYDDSNGVPRPYVNTRMYPAGALRLHALLTKRGRELRKPVFDAQLSLLSGGAA